MPLKHRFAPATLAVFTLLLAPSLLTGCSGVSAVQAASARPAMVSGNWEFSSSATAAAALPAISGEISNSASLSANAAISGPHRDALSASGTAPITGILHSQGSSSCVSPATSFEVSGSADSSGNVTLTGPLAGGTLTLTGALASDGKFLTGTTYNVSGGTCAFAKPALATAQAYTPVSGSYDGTFTDTDGIVATINATLNQSPDADADGNYTLTGTAGLPNNPCFSTSTLALSNTQVTGGTFTLTFADPVTNASITASGTFSPDASSLTVTSWTLTNCSTDAGTGNMTRQ